MVRVILMPLLWRLLLRNYFQIFSLCVFGFISVLLVTRFQEIVRLAALDSQLSDLFLFTLFQIPYVLPIAIPISGLISAILVAQRLSHTQEITAFRAAGIGIKTLRAPLLMAAFFLSIVNFAVTAQLTPRCRHLSYNLIEKAATTNPLFLMKKSKMLKLQDSYVNMEMTQPGKEAEDIIFAVKNKSNDRISLMLAKKCVVEEGIMTGNHVTLISNIAQENALFDNLIIENQQSMSTSASALTKLMKKSTYRLGVEHLPMSALVHVISDPNTKSKTAKHAQFEFCRRLFFPSITFAFTLSGFSLGIQIGRERKKKGIFWAILLSAFTFVCSIASKSFRLAPYAVVFFYSLPLLMLFFASYWFQRRLLKGVE